jgi:preprotein translocase subunit SecD
VRLLVLSIVCAWLTLRAPLAQHATCPAIEVSVAADTPSDSSRSVALDDGRHIPLTEKALLTSADITGARASLTEGQYVINVDLTPESARRIQVFSQHNIGRTLVFLVDGKVIRTPKILDPITGSGFLIGPLEQAEAERLADAISTGCGR